MPPRRSTRPCRRASTLRLEGHDHVWQPSPHARSRPSRRARRQAARIACAARRTRGPAAARTPGTPSRSHRTPPSDPAPKRNSGPDVSPTAAAQYSGSEPYRSPPSVQAPRPRRCPQPRRSPDDGRADPTRTAYARRRGSGAPPCQAKRRRYPRSMRLADRMRTSTRSPCAWWAVPFLFASRSMRPRARSLPPSVNSTGPLSPT